MDSNYLAELMKEDYETFIAQDPENGDFDLVFEIDGKKLYAHKHKLIPYSSTLNSMLSERWTNPNEPITIQDYNFNDFKEFVTFFYSGKCKLTKDNIFAMVDIAEFYNVRALKKACGEFLKTAWDGNNVNQILQLANRYNMIDVIKSGDEFLLKTSKLDLKNIYQMLELAYQYSLENFKKSLPRFISKNLLNFIKSEQFQNLQNAVIYDVVRTNEKTLRQEELFEMVYKRAENRTRDGQREGHNERIKAELARVLPFFKFHLMRNEFLIKFLLERSFLFSGNELSDMFWKSRYTICLEDKNGKMMKGVLDCPQRDKMVDIVNPARNVLAGFDPRKTFSRTQNVWKILQSCKSRSLIKSYGIEWYLVYFSHEWFDIPNTDQIKEMYGTAFLSRIYTEKTMKPFQVMKKDHYLAVKRRNEIELEDYLLAEMIAEDGFEIDGSKFV